MPTRPGLPTEGPARTNDHLPEGTDVTDNPKTHAALTALILDLDTIGQPREWKHKDGQPLTDEERALLMGSTVGDVRAALAAANDFDQRAIDYNQEKVAELNQDLMSLTVVHVAENFSLGPATPRGGFDGDTTEFTPAVTVEQLANAYNAALAELNQLIEAGGAEVDVRPVTFLIGDDGHGRWADVKRITELSDQYSAILAALAEAVALEQRAAKARQRAIALISEFSNRDDDQDDETDTA